jgi:D-alanine-D-alanine ligase
LDDPLKIGFTYDLRNDYLALGYRPEEVGEFDSEETIASLDSAMRALGHEVVRIGNAQALCQRLARGERWDMVFNIAEGLRGRFRESQVPCLLEIYQIPYTFSDPFTCAVTLDKSLAKRLVLAAGIRTPAFAVTDDGRGVAGLRLNYPLFAKPLAEGTGKGVTRHSLIETPEQAEAVCRDLLNRYAQPVLIEEFLPGREFTVSILGSGADARPLGTLEIIIPNPSHAGIYSFETKEHCERMVQYPPLTPGALRTEVEEMALRAYRILECRDAARVDIRLDRENRPNFLEINPLPGLHPTHSDLPMTATAEGMSYRELIRRILQSAAARVAVTLQ